MDREWRTIGVCRRGIVGVHREAKRIKRGDDKRGRRILPLDLTIEILSCLPAKSLVRFRRVSKLWHSITHDPQFIETHLHKTLARPPTLLLFPYYVYGVIDHDFTITRLDCSDDPSAPLNPKHLIRDVLIYASCNGLLCLSDSGTTLVVNPATGNSQTLPPSTHSSSPMESVTTPYFGFEPASKEYKVVCIFTNDKDALVCEVFTLGTDTSWRQIHSSLDFRTFQQYGVAVKGAIYWQTSFAPDDPALRFHLKDECFDRITLPSFENFYRGRNYDVARNFVELQGSLCLPVFPDIMSGPDIRPRMDIWLMTSSSNEWSMKYSVMFPWQHSRQPTPLFIRNGNILVHDHRHGTRLQYHGLHPNSTGGNNSYEEVYRQDERSYRVQFIHVESLVPLPS